MIQTATVFNAEATPFTPEFVANPDHERTDALLEFAQETGLWGLPGAEREPYPEEYQEMYDAFIALNQLRISRDFEEEDEEDEEDEEEPHPDAIDMDEMFRLMEEANVNINDNVPNNAIDPNNANDPNNIVSDDAPPLNWAEITTDFQDYAIDVMVEEGRMEDEMTDEYAISIWASYIEDCWQPCMHSDLNALAGQNELRGILPSTM